MRAARPYKSACAILLLATTLTAATPSAAVPQQPLIATAWAQRWGFAQFAPRWPKHCPSCPADEGSHARLGCAATAIAQIMFFHRRCPSGSVAYSSPEYGVTAANFTREAESAHLCDWGAFASSPPNLTGDASLIAVARYSYAAALIVEKKWGSGDYMLSHAGRVASVSSHYGMNASLLILSDSPHQQGAVSRAVMVAAIVDNLERRLPMKLQIASRRGGHYHHVVVDGFQLGTPTGGDGAHSSSTEAQKLLVHLNIGHSGYDNGWFDFDQPICLRHYQNGTRPTGGGCAFCYDNTTYRQLWTIEPVASSWDASTLEGASMDTRHEVSQQAAKPLLGLEPPAFATEFALNYTVRNFQFGFVVRGTWSVDHQDSTGQLNLRERNDNANASLHPQTEVKDYLLHRLWQKDPGIPQGACVAPIAQDFTQARFVVPENASLLPASTVPGSSVWRVLHSAGSVCVDFTVKSPPDGDVSKLLPSVIEYFGQCTSPTKRQPGEVLGELHNYTDFAFADLPESLFLLPPMHSKCPTTAVMHPSGSTGLGGRLTLGGRMA